MTATLGGQQGAAHAPKKLACPSDQVQELLLKSALFQDKGVAFGIAEKVEVWEYPPGATVFRAGTSADALGILVRGRLVVSSVNAQSGELTPIETLRPGDHFGEIGPLLGGGHTHTVSAEEASIVLRIPLDLLQSLLSRAPSFSFALARRLAMRVVQLGLMAMRHTGSPPPAEPAVSRRSGEPHVEPALRTASGISFVEVSDYDPSPQVLGMVPDRLILEQRLLPLHLKDSKLTVGMVAPRNETALTELKRVLHKVDLEVVAISQDDYQHALIRFRLHGSSATDGKAAGGGLRPENLAFSVIDSEREADKAVRVIGDEVVRVVNKILCAALEREASDVHIEPDISQVRVRFRVHGVLADWSEIVAPSFAKGIAARLKILAGLDITERRMPQDGRIAMNIGRREVDMRISVLPSSRGEKIVLRVFEAASVLRPLERTFVDPNLLSAVRRSLGRMVGAILVAGGTGSGKSTTLYSMLHEARKIRPDTNVLMVEDPIEYRLQGITQVQVNHGIGLGFATVLRAMLRQDPDVIALGETRDPETARTALEAAMTGHLLLTSIHSNDALSTVQRLETLGCTRELIAQSISLILVQRLVRRVCPSCARMELPAPVLQESLATRHLIEREGQVKIPRAAGCEGCNRTGHLGRVAVVESLVINDDVRNALMHGQAMTEVERVALKTGALTPFASYASYLMARSFITGADALVAVAG